MKTFTSAAMLATALVTGSVIPGAAMPVAELSAAAVEGLAQNVALRRHSHYRRAPLYVAPGLYYGCRSGWYCFGPPYRAGYARAWYGGFNSIYGYQGAYWRPPRREPVSAPSVTTPAPDSNTAPATGR
jgi:hypothetical protein